MISFWPYCVLLFLLFTVYALRKVKQRKYHEALSYCENNHSQNTAHDSDNTKSTLGTYHIHFSNITHNTPSNKQSEKNKNTDFSNHYKQKTNELSNFIIERAVYRNIDRILKNGIEKIETLLEELAQNQSPKVVVSKINVITGAIKRESILLINTLYQQDIKIQDFINSIYELRDTIQNNNIKMSVSCELTENVSTAQAFVMYKFLSFIAEKSIDFHCTQLLIRIYSDEETVNFSIVTNEDIKNLSATNWLEDIMMEVPLPAYSYLHKHWEENALHTLSFKKVPKNYRLSNKELETQYEPNNGNINPTLNVHLARKEQEFLRIKNHVHDIMGQRLTTLQHLLQSQEFPNTKQLLPLLLNIVEQIKNQDQDNPQVFYSELYKHFENIGLVIELDGELPKEKDIAFLLLYILRETCTNAVRHGRASLILARISSTDLLYMCTITNNGSPPSQPLREGDGLHGIRERIKSMGANLRIEYEPDFAIIISIVRNKK